MLFMKDILDFAYIKSLFLGFYSAHIIFLEVINGFSDFQHTKWIGQNKLEKTITTYDTGPLRFCK